MFDVIVVGAGPAGATTAKMLADSGLKVLIVERLKLPRYKSCSGVLIKKSMDLVKQYFGEAVPTSVMCTPYDNHGMIFTDDKGKEYAFEQEGLNVWRSSFDNWLTENAVKAGVELRDMTSAVSCEQAEDHIELQLHSDRTYTEQARYVIDCEGVTSALKRNVLNISPKFITTYQTFNVGKIELDPHYFYAYELPFAEALSLSALHLPSQLGAVVFVHSLQECFHDDALRGVGQMLGGGDHPHAILAELMLSDGAVVAVACESVQLVNQHALERVGSTVGKHTLELRSIIVRAGFCPVDVLPDDLQIVLGGVLLADMELPLDALLGLHRGAVAPVESNFLHIKNSSLQNAEECGILKLVRLQYTTLPP